MSEILCTLEKEGFIAHYFPGTKEVNKAIIAVGGASCNKNRLFHRLVGAGGSPETLVFTSGQ